MTRSQNETTPLTVAGTPTLIRDLRIAIELHRRASRNAGRAPSRPLADLDAVLERITASSSQQPTNIDTTRPGSDAEPVPPLAVDYPEAARMLTVSERQLRRIVAAGHLPKIRIGGLVRFRRRDLEAFVTAGGTGAAA